MSPLIEEARRRARRRRIAVASLILVALAVAAGIGLWRHQTAPPTERQVRASGVTVWITRSGKVSLWRPAATTGAMRPVRVRTQALRNGRIVRVWLPLKPDGASITLEHAPR